MKHILSVIVVLMIPAIGLSQTELIRRTPGSSVTTEILIPGFDNPPGSSYSGMVFLLAGNVAITDVVTFHLELPYAQSKFESSSPFGPSSISQSSIGNTYLGVSVGSPAEMVTGEFGVRLNTFSQEKGFAGFTGIYADFPNLERYLVEATSIRAGVNVRPMLTEDLSVLVQFAPTAWIPEKGEIIWMSHYGLGAAYRMGSVTAAAGVNGTWRMNEQGFLFGNKDALHHFQAEVNARFGMFRPGVMFRIPLDKELEFTKFTVGMSVGIVF